jgi:hypothetical protein
MGGIFAGAGRLPARQRPDSAMTALGDTLDLLSSVATKRHPILALQHNRRGLSNGMSWHVRRIAALASSNTQPDGAERAAMAKEDKWMWTPAEIAALATACFAASNFRSPDAVLCAATLAPDRRILFMFHTVHHAA